MGPRVNPLESAGGFLSGLKTVGSGSQNPVPEGLSFGDIQFSMSCLLTAFARSMVNEFEMGRKVRCHKAGL